MDSWSWANGRRCQAIGGQGERDVGCLSFTPSPLALHISGNGSQQAAPLLWLQLSPVTVILFPLHSYLPLHPISSGPGVMLAPQWLILGAPACLVASPNLHNPLSSPFTKVSAWFIWFEFWRGWSGAGTLTDTGFLSPWFGSTWIRKKWATGVCMSRSFKEALMIWSPGYPELEFYWNCIQITICV